MLDRIYWIDNEISSFADSGMRPAIWCSKADGVWLAAIRGSRRDLCLRIWPVAVRVERVGTGRRSFLTGGFPGIWETVIDDGSGAVYRCVMRNEGEARHLKKWIQRHAMP